MQRGNRKSGFVHCGENVTPAAIVCTIHFDKSLPTMISIYQDALQKVRTHNNNGERLSYRLFFRSRQQHATRLLIRRGSEAWTIELLLPLWWRFVVA